MMVGWGCQCGRAISATSDFQMSSLCIEACCCDSWFLLSGSELKTRQQPPNHHNMKQGMALTASPKNIHTYIHKQTQHNQPCYHSIRSKPQEHTHIHKQRQHNHSCYHPPTKPMHNFAWFILVPTQMKLLRSQSLSPGATCNAATQALPNPNLIP